MWFELFAAHAQRPPRVPTAATRTWPQQPRQQRARQQRWQRIRCDGRRSGWLHWAADVPHVRGREDVAAQRISVRPLDAARLPREGRGSTSPFSFINRPSWPCEHLKFTLAGLSRPWLRSQIWFLGKIYLVPCVVFCVMHFGSGEHDANTLERYTLTLYLLYTSQERNQNFGLGGKHQTKFPVRSPKFRSGDIQQKFTQQKLLKFFVKFI